jgi:hypothetical protein
LSSSGCYFWRRNGILQTSGLQTSGGTATKVDVEVLASASFTEFLTRSKALIRSGLVSTKPRTVTLSIRKQLRINGGKQTANTIFLGDDIWDRKCQLVSRRRNAYNSFQGLRDNLATLKVKNAIIDGEIVCLDSEGRSIFNELLHRKGSPIFYAFDLLYLNDRDLRQRPLMERKKKLRALIEKGKLPDVICGKYVEGRGVDLFNEICQRNLEGVVAKRKTGTYSTISGWLKIKNPNYTQSERRHELFESFKVKPTNQRRNLPSIPKKPPLRAISVAKKIGGKTRP